MQFAVREYYTRFLEPKASAEAVIRAHGGNIFVNAEENSVPLVFSLSSYPMDAI
jgi:hypothetical protein